MFKLRQRSTVAAYLSAFESLSTRITNLDPSSLLNCFLSSLRDDIQQELYLLKPQSLHDAIGMAKLVEHKFNAFRTHWPFSCTILARAPITSSPLTSTIHRPSNITPSLPIKRLTPSEMASWCERGLCFNCDSNFFPGHKCSPPVFDRSR